MSLNFKLLRLQAKLTLEEAAREAGVTRGYLSKVERGLAQPSVGTALRLAKLLNVDVETLFGDPRGNEAVVVTRARDQKPNSDVKGMPRLVAGKRQGRRMIAFVMTPGMSPSPRDPMSQHEGEELLYVLEGRVTLTLPNRVEHLEKGDCVQFNSAVPHKVENQPGSEAEILIVVDSE